MKTMPEVLQQQRNETRPESGAMERRFFAAETRAAGEGERVIEGYAAIFGSYTSMGWYAEVIEPGFFDGMDMEETACLFNHDESQVLGRAKNGSLKMKADKKGLKYTSQLPDTTQGRDVYELVKGGYVDQSSFSFTVKKETWERVDRSELEGKLSEDDLKHLSYGGKVDVRRMQEGRKLYDVAPVTFPAYTDTSVAKRSHTAVFGAEEARKKELEMNRLRALLALSV